VINGGVIDEEEIGSLLPSVYGLRSLEAKGVDGRGDRIRTYDPLVPNQMRYQTALLPDRADLLALLHIFWKTVIVKNANRL
jgi:hypothetical protein